MLLFTLVLLEAFRAFFDHEKSGAFGGLRQYGHEIGISPGGDELFGAVDPVSGEGSRSVHDRLGLGFE